jgi:hypothetical protein
VAAILDVWIARPGDACHVDDHAWTVHVADAHGVAYHWAANDYSSLPAPQAHWAGTVPPGCYVVHATLDAKPSVATDHAIVVVGCDGSACVRLYVAGSHRDPNPSDGDCAITITEVEATGHGVIETVQVAGTAAGCAEVEVSVACRPGKEQTTTVTVSPSGSWKATLKGLRVLECKCGGPVTVTATCTADPKCSAKWHEPLKCGGSDKPPVADAPAG